MFLAWHLSWLYLDIYLGAIYPTNQPYRFPLFKGSNSKEEKKKKKLEETEAKSKIKLGV